MRLVVGLSVWLMVRLSFVGFCMMLSLLSFSFRSKNVRPYLSISAVEIRSVRFLIFFLTFFRF